MRREKEREENERRGRKKTLREEIDFGEATRLGRIERSSDIVRKDGLDTGWGIASFLKDFVNSRAMRQYLPRLRIALIS